MSLRRRRRLELQQLEQRETPSVSTTFTNGLLSIRGDNLPNTVVITETAGKLALTVNGKAAGSFAASSLSITMGNSNDTVDLRISTSLSGTLTVNLGNGADTFTTKSSTLGAKVGGNVQVSTGLATFQGLGVGNYEDIVQLYNLIFNGRSTTVVGSSGSAFDIVDVQSASVAGTLSVTNVYVISLGAPGNAALASKVGNLSISNVQKNTDGRTSAPTFSQGLYAFAGSSITGNLSYNGGNGRDGVFLPGDPADAVPVTVGGSVTMTGGGGINTLSLGNGALGADVGSSVTFNGGVGIDRFFLDSGSTVGGNVIASLGEGDNQVFGDSLGLGPTGTPFDPLGAASVSGDLRITLGNGNNFIGTFDGVGTTLSVDGDLRIEVGNGINQGGVVASVGSITLLNTNVTVAGTVTYQAGTGTNELTITNETISRLRLLFSGGGTTLTFAQASGAFAGDTLIDFGVGFGPKTLNAATVTFTGPFELRNYP